QRKILDYPLAAQGPSLVSGYGFTGLPPAPPLGGVPNFAIDPFNATNGADAPRNILSRTYQVGDDFTWIRGSHSFKGGAEYQYVEYADQVTFFSGEEFGTYSFTGAFTGNAFADFLLLLPSSTAFAQNSPPVNPFGHNFSVFVQDDWKVSPRLTLAYGVRYDIRPPWQDKSNQLGNFDRDFPRVRDVVSNQQELEQIPALVRQTTPHTPFVTADEAGL